MYLWLYLWLYAWFTRITLHGGPEKWQKWGRAKWVLSRFCLLGKSGHGCFCGKAPLRLIFFREIFLRFRHVYSQSMSDRFSAHVRPVVHAILFT